MGGCNPATASPRGFASYPLYLQQARLQEFNIVADEERRSCPDGRRSQLSRTAEKQSEKLGMGRAIGRQIEVEDLLSFGYVKMFDAFENGERCLPHDRFLRGVLNQAVPDVVRRKKLLRAFAALSSRAEVLPVERC